MKMIDPSEFHDATEDSNREIRRFIVEISLKLRRKRSRNSEDLSLLEMVIDQ